MCVWFLLQFAVRHLKELEHQKRELQKEGNALIDFFCEDKETMKLDECFQIFRDFCTRFNTAVKVRVLNEILTLLKWILVHMNCCFFCLRGILYLVFDIFAQMATENCPPCQKPGGKWPLLAALLLCIFWQARPLAWYIRVVHWPACKWAPPFSFGEEAGDC